MKDTEQHHEPAPSSAAAQRESRENGGQLSTQLAGSPRQLAQRRAIEQTLGGAVQRVEGELDEEDGGSAQLRAQPVQRQADGLEEEDDGAAQLRAEPAHRQENRTGMPDGLKAGIESMSGMDMSDVRVHRNSSQPAQLNALAYAQGNDIHLGPGQEQHLPHEAWHVVQQRQGRVQATTQLAGVGVNDDAALEEEADVMGGLASRYQHGDADSPQVPHRGESSLLVQGAPPTQRMVVYSDENPPKDIQVVMTLPNVERSVGGPVLHSSQTPLYSEHKAIGFLAHGNNGNIEWNGKLLNGEAFVASELVQQGREVLPGSLIELWSCSAGERSKASTDDSLVDQVHQALKKRGIKDVTVKGVKGGHLVLNDEGDHFVPAGKGRTYVETFFKLRNYYLWLFGFFSDNLVTQRLQGFVQEQVGIDKAVHPVLHPKDGAAANDLIRDLKSLYQAEQEVGGIEKVTSYESFLKERSIAWMKMCGYLRTNSAFKSVMKAVDADWLELRT